ncbi:MAG: 2-amino-4-hydroxy-6-hydroxymethyldihydropteridine diphosphokinase [Oscillospiraceae bacterium]|nr:2-amino-4-hydroxy-6-hydroxymethyldihydropteridine diphosphokinase [Oscillospiraceae bacterium]
MDDALIIKNLRLFAYHGVNEEEKRDGQFFLLNISGKLDASAACHSDKLDDTVSYARMLKTARRLFTGNRWDLLEKAAQVIVDTLLEEFGQLDEVTVEIFKPDAPINADFDAVGVKIHRRRQNNKPKRAVVGLGSNLGEREEYIKQAVAALGKLPDTRVVKMSRIHETAPQGCAEPQGDYLNACVLLETTLSPHALLGALLGVEAAHGRKRPYPNAPRTLDLDLLLYENFRINTPELTLPHPLMWKREFVLVPLGELEIEAV